jgi:hypothetical protein
MGLALLVSACGAGDAGTATTTPGGTTPDTTVPPLEEPETDVRVILTISDEGGFVPVEWNLKRIPRYVVMSDGTVYYQGPVTMEYPGRALPNVQTGTISENDLAEIMALVEESGLSEVTDERNDKGMLNIADAPDTVFVYTDEEGVEHRFSVYALGFEGLDYEDERVSTLEALLARVDQAVASAEPAEPFQPESVEVFVGQRELDIDPQFANTIDWPIETTVDEMTEGPAGFRCAVLEGDAATAALDAFADANELTTVLTEDGTEYTMIVKPLLPGQEPTC